MSKLDPKSREEAYAHQLIDDAKVLLAMAHNGPKSFNSQIAVIEATIAAYRSKRLRKANEKYIRIRKQDQEKNYEILAAMGWRFKGRTPKQRLKK